MTSFENIIRMDENALRAPEKMQPKTVRKPLGDVTNSSNLLAKVKSSAKNLNGFKAQEKVPPKVGKKFLGDLTKSNKQFNKETSSKNCSENLSAVNEERVLSWVPEEGFLHSHSKCMEARRKSMIMSMDYFLEVVGLQRDLPVSECTSQLPQRSTKKELELKTPVELDELEIDMLDICAPPTPPALESPPEPKFPISTYRTMDWTDLDLSPLKLKDSPGRN